GVEHDLAGRGLHVQVDGDLALERERVEVGVEREAVSFRPDGGGKPEIVRVSHGILHEKGFGAYHRQAPFPPEASSIPSRKFICTDCRVRVSTEWGGFQGMGSP